MARGKRRRELRVDMIHLGRRGHWARDFYHLALSSSWTGFLASVLGIYLALNALFGEAYFLCGREAFDGAVAPEGWPRWLECFFFSVQTLGTIGYGKISPVALSSNILMTFEAIAGLLAMAVVTGLVFARFSRPTARVVFSDVALVAPHDGVPSLVFRIANERRNQIVDASVQVHVLRNETTAEGDSFYTFNDLKLERAQSPAFAATWTVVHPITPESPLHGRTRERLAQEEAQIIVTLTGIDETLGQTIRARFLYDPEDLVWGHRFVDMLSWRGETVLVHLERIHDITPA